MWIFLAVSEGEFKAKYPNNPPNLLSKCNYCDHPQPRYKLHEGHLDIKPEFKYLGYKQCLPGCVVIRLPGDKFTKTTYTTSGNNNPVLLTSDTKCVAFDARDCSNAPNCTTTPRATPRTTTSHVNTDSGKSSLKGELSDFLNSQGKI